jgi:hypothetical protein
MLHLKKGMLVLDQDEQMSGSNNTKRTQRHVAFYDEVDGKEQTQEKRARRFVRGMMVMVPQKEERE